MYANEEIIGNPEAEDVELEAEEVEERKILPTPILPSQADIDQHWIDHIPYRSWCGTCVGGRGRKRPHHRTNGKRKIPTVVFDYCCLSRDGTHTREEWAAMTDAAEGVNWLYVKLLRGVHLLM